jgi:hypothetical protein
VTYAFLALGVLVSCGGCGSDPSVAVLRNDLDEPVRLRLCSSNDCAGGFDPPDETLSPGDTWRVNVSSVGVPNVYLVASPDGTRFGCLPLISPELRHEEITVLVSENVACRSDLSEDEFWPARWEHAK